MNIEDLLNMEKYNWMTITSLLLLLAGIIFYVGWGITYGVWADIGIYSFTIILVLFGILGMLVSLHESEGE